VQKHNRLTFAEGCTAINLVIDFGIIYLYIMPRRRIVAIRRFINFAYRL
jgi:hypothetical protein